MKLTLVTILTIILLSFGVFFYKVYILQKDFFNNKVNVSQSENIPDSRNVKAVPSIYTDYSKEIYEKAILDNRVTLLFFTSNWCDKCANQDQVILNVFTDLNTNSIVGLKSHILDSETTTETDAFAKKFDVTKENTIVLLNKKGAVSFKYTGELKFADLKSKILEVGDIK